ncbi:hypothetical protein ABIB40_003227 [Pedobacter sp. UYP30]|uniref:hypothetical protein n=1 Tax=Pedobacter sp. UYP30 TaxID=1756400 RepID=UPI003397945D
MNQPLDIQFKDIKVELEPGLIKVFSNLELWRYLRGKDQQKISFLIGEIKKRYKEKYSQALNIRDSSLLVEILVHVYCHSLGLRILPHLKIAFLKRFLEKLIDRAKVVDCGERNRDTNRWFWDLLAYFKSIVLLIFPLELRVANLR